MGKITKKCKKILSIQKKAVILQPILYKPVLVRGHK